MFLSKRLDCNRPHQRQLGTKLKAPSPLARLVLITQGCMRLGACSTQLSRHGVTKSTTTATTTKAAAKTTATKMKLRLLADESNMASRNGTQVNKTDTGGNATTTDMQNWTNDTSTASTKPPAAEQDSFNSTLVSLNNTGNTSPSTSKPLHTTIAPAAVDVDATTRRPTAAPRAVTYPKPAPTYRNSRPTWSPMPHSPFNFDGSNGNENETDDGSGLPPALIMLLVVLFIVGACLTYATAQSNSPSRKYDGHAGQQKRQHYSHRHSHSSGSGHASRTNERGTSRSDTVDVTDVVEAAFGILEVMVDAGRKCGS